MSVGSVAQTAANIALDPLKAHNFRVVLLPNFSHGVRSAVLGAAGGVISGLIGGFTAIKGMGWKTEVHTVKEGGVNDRVHKLPGRTTCNELVFTKGMALLDPLWEWYSLTLAGRVLRMNGLIYLMSDWHTPNLGVSHMPETGVPLAIWHFTGAWPTELTGVECDASQSVLAVQSMTLAIDSIKKTVSAGSLIPPL